MKKIILLLLFVVFNSFCADYSNVSPLEIKLELILLKENTSDCLTIALINKCINEFESENIQDILQLFKFLPGDLKFKENVLRIIELVDKLIQKSSAQSSMQLSLKIPQKYSFQELITLQIDNGLHNLAFSPDGTKLAIKSGDYTLITIWDVITGQKISELNYDLESLKIKRNLKTLEIQRDPLTFKIIENDQFNVSFLNWSANSKEVIFYHSENIIIWNIDKKKFIKQYCI